MASIKVRRTPAISLFDRWQRRIGRTRSYAVSAARVAPVTAPVPATIPEPKVEPYRVGLAETHVERHAAFRLRFRVFNLEMNEGLDTSYQTGEDKDAFDAVCDQLVVRDAGGEVVGTYRLQTGETAARNLGYYS